MEKVCPICAKERNKKVLLNILHGLVHRKDEELAKKRRGTKNILNKFHEFIQINYRQKMERKLQGGKHLDELEQLIILEWIFFLYRMRVCRDRK